MYSPETLARLATLQGIQTTRELTLDESKEVIVLMRQDRLNARAASDSSRRVKAKAAVLDGADLLAELDGLK